MSFGVAAGAGRRLGRAKRTVVLAVLAGVWPVLAGAADPSGSAQSMPRVYSLPGGVPQGGSRKPMASIPVAPLGYNPPGAIYLGERNSLVSLDFIDEDHLLFSFRVPGLLHRAADQVRASGSRDDIRQIRVLVLRLPSGTIDTEALWTVHDRARYLWMLRDGHFLLRDGDTVQQGDASLELKPLLHLPGPVIWLELDPENRYIVTSSREPQKPSPGTIHHVTDDLEPDTRPNIVLRIVRREDARVMLESRVRALTHLAFNSEGYVEALRSRGIEWLLTLNAFTGGSRTVGTARSTCTPRLDFLDTASLLATGCGIGGDRQLQAISLTDARTLWVDEAAPASVWPEMTYAAGGSRLMEETMESTHPVSATAPLAAADVMGQAVRVLDAATGRLVFETAASPVYDVGGNAALSPSGHRLAVLNHGALEVFDLEGRGEGPSPAAVQPTAGTARRP